MNKELYNLKNCNTRKHRYNFISRRDIARAILRTDNGKFKGITEHKFNLIINRILELKVAELYNNGYVHLGHGLGNITISLRKRIKDSIKNYVVDWDKTLKLWLDNEKAKQDKKLVRVLDYDKYIKYTWSNRDKCSNLKYYNFIPLRTLRKKLYFDVVNNKNIMFYE